MSLRACIEILGLTQREAAAIFKVNERTVRGWLGGRSNPPTGWRSILAAHVRQRSVPCLDTLRSVAPERAEAIADEIREREREARWKAKQK